MFNQKNTTIIANKYRLLNQIGEGAFGKVYRGENIRTRELVACKLEPEALDIKLLKNETKAYLLLAKESGFPRIKWYGIHDLHFYMVIDFLGESLKNTVSNTDSSFTLVEVLKLGIQMIQRIQSVHSVGLIHRDIKPDNFLFGKTMKNLKMLYLVDFGLCRGYRQESGEHIPEKIGKAIIGSPNFVSLNVHEGAEPSRRDDLESVVYVMFYLFNPNFLELETKIKEENLPEIYTAKKRKFVNRFPDPTIFSRLLNYCKGLRFNEEPNYNGLIKILEGECKNLFF